MRLFPLSRSNGVATIAVGTNWRKVDVKVQRLKTKAGKQAQMYLDASLDKSGWSPEALERLSDLAARLPYEEASLVAGKFGLNLSRTLINSLTHSYASSCQHEVSEQLLADSAASQTIEARASTPKPGQTGRVMVLPVDGVCVLGQPQAMEIKSAVLYPQASPGERWMLADKCKSKDFLPNWQVSSKKQA